MSNEPREIRASQLQVGDIYNTFDDDSDRTVLKRDDHGDAVLITTPFGGESSHDGDEVVRLIHRQDPPLSGYDTGAVLEPKPWADTAPHHLGNVDFDDEEANSIITVRVVRNPGGDGYTVIVRNLHDDVAISIQHEK